MKITRIVKNSDIVNYKNLYNKKIIDLIRLGLINHLYYCVSDLFFIDLHKNREETYEEVYSHSNYSIGWSYWLSS